MLDGETLSRCHFAARPILTEKKRDCWNLTKEEEAEIAAERERRFAYLNTLPEYRKSNDDRRYLHSILTDLLFDENSEFERDPIKPQEAVKYRLGKPEGKSGKLPFGDADGYETQAYRMFREKRNSFSRLLRIYAERHRGTPWHTAADPNDPLYHIGFHNTEILHQGLNRGAKSFEVGSSLYVYQQMYDRNRCETPSLSKATWLLKTCYPTRFGSLKSMQEQWKFNVDSAHYWAAIATLMRQSKAWTPSILLDFICNADVDEFERLAQAFYEFRQRVKVPHSSSAKRVYLKDLSPGVPYRFWDVEPISPLDIPDPLDEDQWRLLKRYRVS